LKNINHNGGQGDINGRGVGGGENLKTTKPCMLKIEEPYGAPTYRELLALINLHKYNIWFLIESRESSIQKI